LFEVLTRRDRAVLLDLASKLESWSQTFKLAVERKPAHEGRLIALEGIDGVLLHDLGERLAKHLRRRGDVTYCGDNHEGRLWRYMMQRLEQIDAADPGLSVDKTQVLERTLLFACERLYRQETAVRPLLHQGHAVIAPFYTMAPAVYQELEGVGDTRFIDI